MTILLTFDIELSNFEAQLLNRIKSAAAIGDVVEINPFNQNKFPPWRVTTDKTRAVGWYGPLARGKHVHDQFTEAVRWYWDRVNYIKPKVIISLGANAFWLNCNKSGLKANRGYLHDAHNEDVNAKVIPTWPMTSVVKQWSLNSIVMSDFCKARELAEGRKPATGSIIIKPTIQDLKDFYHSVRESSPFLAADIETLNGTITVIGFAASPECAISIPFYEAPGKNYWKTFEEERTAWNIVRHLCQMPLVGQNFSYDMKYLYLTMGIECPGFMGDTMLLHHTLEPEMEKGLGMLGSLYTMRPAWKQMGRRSRQSKKGE